MNLRLLAVLVPCLSAAAQDEKVTLRWKFEKGQVLRYEMTQTSQTDVNGMEMSQEMLFGYTMEVVAVDDQGEAELKTTYDRVKFKMSGMMESDYDSDRDGEPADAMTRMMAAFAGKTFTMRMDVRGKIRKVEGMEKILEEMTKTMEEEGIPTETIKQMFDDERMGSMMQSGFALLPEDAVGKGDSWESEESPELPMWGKMKQKNRFAFKEVRAEGREAVLDLDQKTEMESGGGMMEMKEMTGKFEVVWGVEEGRMRSYKGTSTMTMSANGQEFTTTTKMEVEFKPKKKEY